MESMTETDRENLSKMTSVIRDGIDTIRTIKNQTNFHYLESDCLNEIIFLQEKMFKIFCNFEKCVSVNTLAGALADKEFPKISKEIHGILANLEKKVKVRREIIGDAYSNVTRPKGLY